MKFPEPGVAQKTILVVCTGNVCRSPIAQAFINSMLEQDQLQHRISVMSAGLNVKPGQKPSEFILNEIKLKYGLDISRHQSQPVTSDLFHRSSLVLVMEQEQLMRLARQYPRQTKKLHLLSELSGRVFDIEDGLIEAHVDIGEMMEQIYNLVTKNLVTLLSWLELTSTSKE